MVEVDYIFDADALRDKCRQQDLLSDYALVEWEMLMRLRVGNVDVFGHSEEEYQRWMNSLKSHNLSLYVPSSAWSLLPVLSIAVSVDRAFARLREEGCADIDAIDSVIWLERQGDTVKIYHRRDRIGWAPFTEIYEASVAFAERVRRDFLSICPRLYDHVALGPWFRGESTIAAPEKRQGVIYLPPTTNGTRRG